MASDNQRRVGIATAIATAIAVPAEGIRRVAYYDPPGILTVCRGHTGTDVHKGKTYSVRECDAFMDADMHKAVALVERCVPGLPSHVLAAFADAVYNMGPKVACDPANSHAARYLRAGQLTAACGELPKWNRASIGGALVPLPGLTKRREQERQVCLTGEDAA